MDVAPEEFDASGGDISGKMKRLAFRRDRIGQPAPGHRRRLSL
jgi:hypothetical protein